VTEAAATETRRRAVDSPPARRGGKPRPTHHPGAASVLAVYGGLQLNPRPPARPGPVASPVRPGMDSTAGSKPDFPPPAGVNCAWSSEGRAKKTDYGACDRGRGFPSEAGSRFPHRFWRVRPQRSAQRPSPTPCFLAIVLTLCGLRPFHRHGPPRKPCSCARHGGPLRRLPRAPGNLRAVAPSVFPLARACARPACVRSTRRRRSCSATQANTKQQELALRAFLLHTTARNGTPRAPWRRAAAAPARYLLRVPAEPVERPHDEQLRISAAGVVAELVEQRPRFRAALCFGERRTTSGSSLSPREPGQSTKSLRRSRVRYILSCNFHTIQSSYLALHDTCRTMYWEYFEEIVVDFE